MRKLQITLIALFLAVAIAFCAVFLHDRLTADHTAPRIVSDGVPLEVSVNATDAAKCVGQIERTKFYEKAAKAYVTICTSERLPYGCIILQKGVM